MRIFSILTACAAFAQQVRIPGPGGSAPSGGGPITVVQALNAHSNNNPTTVSITATAGNMLYVVVAAQANGAGCGSFTVTDSASPPNTYTAANSLVNQGFNCSGDFYAKNITGGTFGINVNFSSSLASSAVVYEISGLNTSAPLDATTTQICSASPCTSGSFTTTSAKEIIFVGATNYYNAGTWTPGAIGGTTATIASGGSWVGIDASMSSAIEYRIVSATQSGITGAISISGSVYMDLMVSSFKQ